VNIAVKLKEACAARASNLIEVFLWKHDND